MRIAKKLLLSLLIVGLMNVQALADDLRNGYTPSNPVPKHISDICADLGPTFTELRNSINVTGGQAEEAGNNAKGLSFGSPSKHYRSIEDNDIIVNKVLEPSLDEVSDIPVALDDLPETSRKQAAMTLAKAYDAALRQIKSYSHAALVFERAANGRHLKQAAAFAERINYGPGVFDLASNSREMTADDARAMLDSESSDIGDASRSLKLPETRWARACSNPDTAYSTKDDVDPVTASASIRDQTAKPAGINDPQKPIAATSASSSDDSNLRSQESQSALEMLDEPQFSDVKEIILNVAVSNNNGTDDFTFSVSSARYNSETDEEKDRLYLAATKIATYIEHYYHNTPHPNIGVILKDTNYGTTLRES